MDSERHSSRKLPIYSKSKAQKRKAVDEGTASVVDQVQTTRPDIGFRFRNKSTKKIFQERFHDRTVIAERPVNLSDLQDSNFQMISQIFTQRRWEYFIAPPARPFINLVREFYENMDSQQISDESIDAPLQILSFIRGVPIVVTREVIAEVTGIPLIEEPRYPYPTEEFPSKFDMSKLFIPPDSYNHWQDYMTVIPLGHLSYPVKLLARIILDSEPTMKHLGPFCKATVSQSKGQMRLRGTKDFEAASDPAATTKPGPSGGASTSAHVSLEDVMAKLNVMAAQMTTFSSILATLQTDVKELKTKIVGSSRLDEDTDEEQSMSD
ncbi:hypothetical protein FH972_009911 [Carpinus fangiana]|uniref:Uncharacterized protein n=1 Tax=Carpinus fangiana TaxID=176857 RepID=A0A660KNM6_9ROSI|nr:hypothetical protein FH972_009911 [Carpinus fangiana]